MDECIEKSFEEYASDCRDKILVDLRDERAYRSGSPDRSVHIPWESFDENRKTLDFSKPVYLMCYQGETSLDIATALRKEGLEVYSIKEGARGFLRWYFMNSKD